MHEHNAITEVIDLLHQIKDGVEATTMNIRAMVSRIESTEQKLSKQELRITELVEKISDLQTQSGRMHSTLESFDAKITKVKNRTDEIHAVHDKSMILLTENTETLKNGFVGTMADVSKKLDFLRGRFDNFDKRLDHSDNILDENHIELTRQIDALQSGLDKIGINADK